MPTLAMATDRREVAVNAVPRRKVPRHHGGAAGRTDAARDGELTKLGAVRRELVEVGRLQIRMVVATQITPAPIVREDEDDVRLRTDDRGCGNEEGGPGPDHVPEVHSRHPIVPRLYWPTTSTGAEPAGGFYYFASTSPWFHLSMPTRCFRYKVDKTRTWHDATAGGCFDSNGPNGEPHARATQFLARYSPAFER